MNTNGLFFGILEKNSFQTTVDKIVRDASQPAFYPSSGIPSRTTAYKGYHQNVKKAHRSYQKKPHKPKSLDTIEK